MIAWSNPTSPPDRYPGGAYHEKIEIYIDVDFTVYVVVTEVHVHMAGLPTRTCLAELERIECKSLDEAKAVSYGKYQEYENSYLRQPSGWGVEWS